MTLEDPKVMARLHRDIHMCEWCQGDVCGNQGLQCHHIYCRGMGGAGRLDLAWNLVMLGLECHAKAQGNKIPRSVLWGIAAEREVYRILRLPKGSDIHAA